MSTELQELDELEELAKRYGKDKDSDWYHKRANLIEKKWHKVLQAQARGKAAAGVVGAAANNPVEDGKRKHYQWSTIKKLTNTTQAKAEQALLVALGVKGPLMCGRPHSGACSIDKVKSKFFSKTTSDGSTLARLVDLGEKGKTWLLQCPPKQVDDEEEDESGGEEAADAPSEETSEEQNETEEKPPPAKRGRAAARAAEANKKASKAK